VSQNVSIKESSVKGWVDKAGQLNDGQKAAWNEYVAGADFNTNNVGEAR
jgi:hypothetical protein